MSFKTILVHLNRTHRSQSVLKPALDLARRYASHVVGIYVAPGIQSTLVADSLSNASALRAGVAGKRQQAEEIAARFVRENANALRDAVAAERQEAEEIAATFVRETANQPFTAEWRAVEAPHSDIVAIVLEHAYAADIVVVSQNDPDWERSSLLDFPERLTLESGRPVLVVPCLGHYREVGRNVVIAWKPSREAARAVFDALPILKCADTVNILQIAERRDELPRAETAIAATLARHGLKAEIHNSQALEIGVGDQLLSRLADLGADLLVMGAYGHSRLREYVFGGATRHITQHMTVPTLFSQ